MRLVTFDIGTMKYRVIAQERSVTITTAHGRFTIAEQEDGSLAVHESGHRQLAVLPRAGNTVELRAIEPQDQGGKP